MRAELDQKSEAIKQFQEMMKEYDIMPPQEGKGMNLAQKSLVEYVSSRQDKGS